MKLFLDDIRPLPDNTWTLARTIGEAKTLLATNSVEVISLDHDLGTTETGYDLCNWMARHKLFPKIVLIHSLNPVGAKKMRKVWENYQQVYAR